MLKMLLLYRRFFRDTLLTMAGYVVILVAGVWLTDISLFESYVLATPLLAMVLPAVFANNALTNLALSFGASRRLCYWGRQAGSVLVAACCMAMTWLTYRLAEGGIRAISELWSRDMVALLFAVCLFVLQSSTLSQTMENGWRRTAVLVGAWALGFAYIVVVQAFLIIDDLSNVPLWPVSLRQPLWFGGWHRLFWRLRWLLGVLARLRYTKLVVKTMKKSMTGQAALPFPRFFARLAVYAALRYAGAAASPVCLLAAGPGGFCWWLPGRRGGLDDASALAIPTVMALVGSFFAILI